jgi:hypothetical protein
MDLLPYEFFLLMAFQKCTHMSGYAGARCSVLHRGKGPPPPLAASKDGDPRRVSATRNCYGSRQGRSATPKQGHDSPSGVHQLIYALYIAGYNNVILLIAWMTIKTWAWMLFIRKSSSQKPS